MTQLFRLCIILMMVISLAACGTSKDDKDTTDDSDKKTEEKAAKKKDVLPICPQVAIIRDIDQVQDYGTEKPDPSELVGQSKMLKVNGDCGYQDNGIDIKFDLDFISVKGPRLGGLRATFPYFVAVVDPQQNILNKERMTLQVGYSSDSKVQTQTESLHIFIPLSKADRAAGPNYQVLMGFQLTQEQLDAVIQKRDKPVEGN
ncbi:MAG TPA: hypothetical protein VFR09_06235 [Alphaproteobacteria bacterium]|nr:hypothetical protein [Alphaproteobacteria bacterium]